MSTRGLVGMIKNGVEKFGYNHYDSYPSYLGKEILKWLSKKSIDELNTTFDSITCTNDESNDVWNDNNSEINLTFEDYHSFIYNSLFCEFAYVVNLDENVLEFYVGYNKNPNADGRYAFKKSFDGDYYGCRLELEIPLNEINKWSINDETDCFEKTE